MSRGEARAWREWAVIERAAHLDPLALFVAYSMAKEFKININHGFNLQLAAQEWKTW